MRNHEVGLVNCAGCGEELLGERTVELLKGERKKPRAALGKKKVAARVMGRPYCDFCFDRGVHCESGGQGTLGRLPPR